MPNPISKPLVIQASRLADGLGGAYKTNQAILVTEDRITAVGPKEEIQQKTPPDAEIIDLGSACIAPGLIDGHKNRLIGFAPAMKRALTISGPAVIEVQTERDQPYSGLPLTGWADYPTPEYLEKEKEPDKSSNIVSE